MKKVLIVLGILFSILFFLPYYASSQVDKGFETKNGNKVFLAGHLQIKMWLFEDASKTLEKGLQKYPKVDKSANAKFWLATCYEKLGKPKKAILMLETFLEEHPKHEWSNLAERRLANLKASN